MKKVVAILMGAAVVVAVGALFALRGKSVGPYPDANLLVISIDTLRPDRLGAYGYPKDTSPRIDALAAAGVTFERAFAPRGLTWPSLATMLTSLSPATTNVRANGQYLAREVATLPGRTRQAGFRNGAFLGGSICHLARSRAEFDRLACGDDEYVTENLVGFLRDLRGERFLAWLHVMAPHAPYDPPERHDVFTDSAYEGPVGRRRFDLDGLVLSQRKLTAADRRQLDGLYDGEVRFSDELVGRVIDTLEETGLRGRTIVILVADHGEDLYEHHGYLYHACSIYDTSLRIPMILVLPDAAQAGRRVAEVVEMEDVLPTLLELAGLERLPAFEGESLVPEVAEAGVAVAEAAEDEPFAFAEWYDVDDRSSLYSVRTRRWRYIDNPDGLTPHCVPKGDYYKVERQELYDLEADPGESRNLAAEQPDLVRRLTALTRAARAGRGELEPQQVDPNLYEELRSFGYIE